MIFDTKVHGIPCQCKVQYFTPYRPSKGMGNEAHPPEPTEFCFELLDRRGYKAPWLEKHLTDEDFQQLLDEYQAARLADQYDIHF